MKLFETTTVEKSDNGPSKKKKDPKYQSLLESFERQVKFDFLLRSVSPDYLLRLVIDNLGRLRYES